MNVRAIVFMAAAPLLLLVLLAPLLTDASFIQLEHILAGPTLAHPLGFDELGRDVLSRLSQTVLLSFKIGLSVMVLTALVGVTLGVVAGWYGGWVDAMLMRLTDTFLAFPGILVAIAFAALSGPGEWTVIIALSLMGWVTFARLARVETQRVVSQDYIKAAILAGTATPRIWQRHVLPNIAAPLIVEAVFVTAGAIIAEAGLSFLGIGIQPPQPSLGNMLKEGVRYMLVAPHLVFAPGATLMLIVLVLNLCGDKIRDFLDKRAG